MSPLIGIVLSLGALLSWGLGNYQIQRATRAIGIWKSLFFVSLVGFLGFFPFVLPELTDFKLEISDLLLFAAIGLLMILASLADLMALKLGKLSIISPLDGLELPITILIGMLIVGGGVSYPIFALMTLVFVGVILSVFSKGGLEYSHRFEDGSYSRTKIRFEKGIVYGFLAALGLAGSNILVGFAARQGTPLLTLWMTSALLLTVTFIYLVFTRQLRYLVNDLSKYPGLILMQSVLDNLGWLFYAYAALALPLAIVTSISQGYIVLAVILGYVLNREKILLHQKAGIALAVAAILSISFIIGQS